MNLQKNIKKLLLYVATVYLTVHATALFIKQHGFDSLYLIIGSPIQIKTWLHRSSSSIQDKSKTKDSCLYRPNTNILNDSDTYTYSNIHHSGFPYAYVIRNDYNYYMNIPDHCPRQTSTRCLEADGVITAYSSRLHDRPKDNSAVILLHGNSSIPDDLFLDNDVYMNGAGLSLYNHGYDIYAPYIVHNSRFQTARRRLATLKNEDRFALDALRIVNLIEHLKSKYNYSSIHIAGLSLGGKVAGQTYAYILNRRPKLLELLGSVLSIEGFIPHKRALIWGGEQNALFAWNWESVFPEADESHFFHLLSKPNFYVGQGSCDREKWDEIYKNVPKKKIIHYIGGHEFFASTVIEAIGRYEKRNTLQ